MVEAHLVAAEPSVLEPRTWILEALLVDGIRYREHQFGADAVDPTMTKVRMKPTPQVGPFRS